MFPDSSSFYAQWRLRCGPGSALRESATTPPERLLQAIWHHQRLRRDRFVTLDGQRLQVLHPGFWNHEAGPDFRDAVLQFNGDTPRSGDVEIDLRPSGWRAHGHERNPRFQNVILHVVWEGQEQHELPVLPLQGVLDAPLPELGLWLGSDTARAFPSVLLGQCAAPLSGLDAGRTRELLWQAALVRLHAKAAHFQARARQAGWEQALWEGLFRALGYKQNIWPMQRLGELRPRFFPERAALSPIELQARLLGVAGLLPAELSLARGSANKYLRRVWDYWWRERESLDNCALPRALWRLHNLRPANHPQRRLALAAHWLAARDVSGALEKWCAGTPKAAELAPTLLQALQPGCDDFWSWHWTLRARRLPAPQPLLGSTRVTDLAMNVVLPWLWVRAVEGNRTKLQAEIERRFFAWPSGQDNSVLRLARQRLLGASARKLLRGAAAQQGLLQVVRDFCEHSNALCTDCQFPELVREWEQ